MKWNARRITSINKETKHRYLEQWYLNMLRSRYIRITCGAMQKEVAKSHKDLQCALRELSELRQFKDVVINSAGTESLIVKRVRLLFCMTPRQAQASVFGHSTTTLSAECAGVSVGGRVPVAAAGHEAGTVPACKGRRLSDPRVSGLGARSDPGRVLRPGPQVPEPPDAPGRGGPAGQATDSQGPQNGEEALGQVPEGEEQVGRRAGTEGRQACGGARGCQATTCISPASEAPTQERRKVRLCSARLSFLKALAVMPGL